MSVLEMRDKLAEAIEKWLPQRENRNLSLLSKKTATSYSTMRRIAQKEAIPSRDTALRIAQVVMHADEFNSFVDSYCSDMKRLMYKPSDLGVEETDYTSDEKYFPIIVLASSKQGTNEAEVKDFLGRDAVKYFNDLIGSGYLNKHGENWRAPDFDSYSLPKARKLMHSLLDICQAENDTIDYAAHSHVAWESLSPEAAKELHIWTHRYIKGVMEIVTNPKNSGDVLVCTGALFNVVKGQEILG